MQKYELLYREVFYLISASIDAKTQNIISSGFQPRKWKMLHYISKLRKEVECNSSAWKFYKINYTHRNVWTSNMQTNEALKPNESWREHHWESLFIIDIDVLCGDKCGCSCEPSEFKCLLISPSFELFSAVMVFSSCIFCKY